MHWHYNGGNSKRGKKIAARIVATAAAHVPLRLPLAARRSDIGLHLVACKSVEGGYDKSERRATVSGAAERRSWFQVQTDFFFTAARRSVDSSFSLVEYVI